MLPAFVAEIPLATLDAGRMGWSDVPLWAVLAGYALLIAGIAVTTWAQAVNPFFEPGVRIQRERGQRAITSGPYRFIRHPGYAAAIAMFVGIALPLASWWALLPAAQNALSAPAGLAVTLPRVPQRRRSLSVVVSQPSRKPEDGDDARRDRILRRVKL
jgi:isoprenylcysteine carboxyl methyltransferase (ICMT) family protein YpbQ